MRIHPEYDPDEFYKYDIFLDGKPVGPGCYFADDEAGEARIYCRTGENTARTKILKGKVEFRRRNDADA